MRVFAITIKYALNILIQRSHDADASQHRRTAPRRDKHQGLHGVRPLRWRDMLCLGKLGDVVAGILEGHERAAG
jgi:hypothetical protein